MINGTKKVGVLALQGAFQKHLDIISSLGAEAVAIRYKEQIAGCDGLIIPGGESTTMSKLMDEMDLRSSLENFPGMIFGTCAGAILLADSCDDPRVNTLHRTPLRILRNAYGRQIESFIDNINLQFAPEPFRAVFIRAPKLNHLDVNTEVLARLNGDAILVKSGQNLVATFHPELTNDNRIHQYFVNCLQ
jgi:5'-phosphate synthase pdxT subunit